MTLVKHMLPQPMATVTMVSRKRSLADMTYSKAPSKVIDDETYRTHVLHLSPPLTEEDIDAQLAHEAYLLGLMPLQLPTDVDGIASLLSATTIASEPNHHTSILSESTAPTSCSSSERRPVTKSSRLSEKSAPQSNTPSILSDIDTRRGSTGSGFRKGFRKMTGFRKRKSVVLDTSAFKNIHSQIDRSDGNRYSIQSEARSPISIKSSKSSWSAPPSATKQSFEQSLPVDSEALQRTMESKELLNLRSLQIEERDRFLRYQRDVLDKLRSQHITSKSNMVNEHRGAIDVATKKNEKAIDDLEARQLEEEMKKIREHEYDKKATMVRLRHMEAYCQSITPPPVEDVPMSKGKGPEIPTSRRKVTDKDYHNLAQVYRERDAMDVLHTSKINVLRGKQKRAVEDFAIKKEREIEALEWQHAKEIELLDREARRDEDNLMLAFGVKRAQIETRWRLQALVQRTKLEKGTGLKYAAMPDVLAIDGQNLLLVEARDEGQHQCDVLGS